MQLSHGWGGRQLCVAGGMTFCCRCKMKLVDGLIIPWIVDLWAVTALMSKLRFEVNWVRHTKWEDQEDEQGLNRNIMQFLVSQVEYTNNTIWPPVSHGHWESPFRDRALRRWQLKLRCWIWSPGHSLLWENVTGVNSFDGSREGRNDHGDGGSGGGCEVFCSFYCLLSPGIWTKHAKSSVGLW